MTLQGQAIELATQRFGGGGGRGDGGGSGNNNKKTLPFTPCKKGYLPFCSTTGKRMYACPLHNEARQRRVESENGQLRVGEVNLHLFWEKKQKQEEVPASKQEEEEEEDSSQPQNKKKKQPPRRKAEAHKEGDEEKSTSNKRVKLE